MIVEIFHVKELSQNSLLKTVSKILQCCDGIKLNTEAVTNLYSISITLLAFANEEMKENAGGKSSLLYLKYS